MINIFPIKLIGVFFLSSAHYVVSAYLLFLNTYDSTVKHKWMLKKIYFEDFI